MNDAVDCGILRKDLVQLILVGDVGLVELWTLARDELDAVKGDLGGVVEAVYDDDFVAMLEEGQRCEGPNVASATA